jgi:hypothetical protein
MAWCIGTTDMTVTTDKVVVGISGYEGYVGRHSRCRGCRTFMIAVGKIGRGRSGGMSNSCSTGVSRRASTMRSSEGVCWFVKWRSRFLQHLQCSHCRKRHSA